MTHNFPYLKDADFLKQFNKVKLKEQLVKIIVLTFNEQPIAEIQGKVISGNISLDGSSSMRRTCNLTMLADEYENDLTDTKNLLSINKKVEVLIGFINNTDKYLDYPILWFPQGIYAIIAPNISKSSSGINISLTLHDKMAFLNGECGGTLPASIILNQVEDIDENGQIVIRQPTIYQIIQQLVNHFGGQQLGKIIIGDLDNRARKVMKWIGSTPIYYAAVQNGSTLYNSFTTNYAELISRGVSPDQIKTFEYGDDVGYIFTDLVYPGDLISKAGDTIASILDQIKNVLGNYEYFYDINGNFVFQQIKNYLNKSYSSFVISAIDKDNYLTDYSNGKSVYTFEDLEIVTAVSNSPQYQQIKNDFVVWEKRKSLSGKQIPIRYHLAIDKKPEVGNSYQVFFFTDPDDDIEKAKKPLAFDTREDFPNKGEIGNYYLDKQYNIIYEWDNSNYKYQQTEYSIETVTSTDFRTQLYLQGINSQPFGLDSNYYYTELQNQWPKLYDIRKRRFLDDAIKHPDEIDFFLDFIDSQAAIGEFSIQNIGRRTTVLTDDSINCIFPPDTPDVVIIESGTPVTTQIRNECERQQQQYVQVESQIYDMLSEGGSSKSAYEEIKRELYQYTSYNEQVSLTLLPVYYLEPNTRITVRDSETGIYGDYMIKTISLPLDINGTMNISCTKALERL